MRNELPINRTGFTKTVHVGAIELKITVNRDEDGRPIKMFSKASGDKQGEVDGMCGVIGIALQGGTYDEVYARLVKFLKFRRYSPEGFAGQACSLSDALGRVLEEAKKENGR